MYELHEHQVTGAGYALIVISTFAVLARFYMQWVRRDQFRREDLIVLFAFAVLLCLGAIYIYVTPIVYRVADVGDDTFREYSGFLQDAVTQLKVTFASAILFPTVLWAVKLSLMSISHRVIQRQSAVIRCWWVLFVFVGLVSQILSSHMP
jgi:hypothetical protein